MWLNSLHMLLEPLFEGSVGKGSLYACLLTDVLFELTGEDSVKEIGVMARVMLALEGREQEDTVRSQVVKQSMELIHKIKARVSLPRVLDETETQRSIFRLE